MMVSQLPFEMIFYAVQFLAIIMVMFHAFLMFYEVDEFGFNVEYMKFAYIEFNLHCCPNIYLESKQGA